MRGGECQNGRVNYAVRWAGWSHWWGESHWHCNTTYIHPSSIYIGCTEQTHNQIETHGHTVRHSKINAVRTTMIPLHYLHTGPPSHTCLPHCPLHGSSVEVVITKANISCSLCFWLASSSSLFLDHLQGFSVPLHFFCQLVRQMKSCQC